MSRTGDVIQRALDAWDKYGWCRDSFVDSSGHVCALGALQWAWLGAASLSVRGDTYQLAEVVARYLPADYLGPYVGWSTYPGEQVRAGQRLAGYNDQYGYAAIREVFEKAALNEGVTL